MLYYFTLLKTEIYYMQIAGQFDDATEDDIKKAKLEKDVCCICLSEMKLGRVKKMMCNHLLHTKCICEVVEKAKSIQAALCPLCRVSLGDQNYQVCLLIIYPSSLSQNLTIICLGTYANSSRRRGSCN